MGAERPPKGWSRESLKRLVRYAPAALGLVACLAVYAAPSRATKELAARKYPGRIPVRFWHMWSAEWKDVVDKIVARYNESQDKYEVIALSVPGGADTKFLLGTVGGDPPDVMAQWNPVIPTWAGNDLLTPFDELMSPAEKARYEREAYPVVKKIGLYKGKTYGIPIGLNLFAVYYLPEHFRQAGLNPDRFPRTLEELTRQAELLTRRDEKGDLKRLGFMPGNFSQLAPLFAGGFYDARSQRAVLDTPANLRALKYLADYRGHYGYNDILRFESGLNTASFAGGWPFIGGAYSAIVEGQWRVEQLGKYAPGLEYRTAPLPAPSGGVPGAGFSNGNFMVVPRSAKQKAGAWDFVKFWSGIEHPERAAQFYTMGGWLPLSDAIASAPAYRAYVRKYPQFETFVKGIKSPNLQVLPPVAYQVFVADQVARDEDLAVRGVLSPQAALKEMQSKVDQERARRKELGYRE